MSDTGYPAPPDNAMRLRVGKALRRLSSHGPTKQDFVYHVLILLDQSHKLEHLQDREGIKRIEKLYGFAL